MRAMPGFIAVVIALTLTGCVQTRPVTLNVNADPATRPKAIEVRTLAGKRHVLLKPEVRGDTLYGLFDHWSPKPAKFALSEIESAQTAQTVNRKLLAVLLMVDLIVLYVLYNQLSHMQFDS
jgi:hypothetical protein